MRFRRRSIYSSSYSRDSSPLATVLVLLALALIGGTIAFLATSDLPAPSRRIEKDIPTDQFPR